MTATISDAADLAKLEAAEKAEIDQLAAAEAAARRVVVEARQRLADAEAALASARAEANRARQRAENRSRERRAQLLAERPELARLIDDLRRHEEALMGRAGYDVQERTRLEREVDAFRKRFAYLMRPDATLDVLARVDIQAVRQAAGLPG